jgi:hypothetical protein
LSIGNTGAGIGAYCCTRIASGATANTGVSNPIAILGGWSIGWLRSWFTTDIIDASTRARNLIFIGITGILATIVLATVGIAT